MCVSVRHFFVPPKQAERFWSASILSQFEYILNQSGSTKDGCGETTRVIYLSGHLFDNLFASCQRNFDGSVDNWRQQLLYSAFNRRPHKLLQLRMRLEQCQLKQKKDKITHGSINVHLWLKFTEHYFYLFFLFFFRPLIPFIFFFYTTLTESLQETCWLRPDRDATLMSP